MELIKKIIISIFSTPLILYAIYFFCFDRQEQYTLSFFVIIATCAFLIFITYSPKRIIGMEIQDMKLQTAQHYHSTIVNMILGFITVIGIGTALIWNEQGLEWRKNVLVMFAYLMIYFIGVMYLVFLRDLIKQIAKKNR